MATATRTRAIAPDGWPMPAEGINGYCMGCREERGITKVKPKVMANGRPATTGECPVCATAMYRLGRG